MLHRFLTRIGFKNALTSDIRLAQRKNRYSIGEMILALLYPMILGLERIETTQLLRQNGVFQYLTGLPSYPDATALRRFLLRVAPTALPKLRALDDRFLERIILIPGPPSRVIFDVDSTVLVVYGKQEQARIGYNAVKRGRPSCHPLLCFEGQSRDFWHGELRPGDAHTASGVLGLLEACFAKVPVGVEIDYSPRRQRVLRSPPGRMARCSKGRLRHRCAPDRTHQAQARSPALHDCEPGRRGRRVPLPPARWRRSYRFVVIRRPQPEEPTEQLTLFKLGRYHYQVLVSNLPLQPLNLWRFYNDRAGIELVIRQLKGDYALGHIPGHHFRANETYFHLLLLAYNLTNWFKRLCSAAGVSTSHAPDPASEDSVDACATRSHREPLAAQSPRQRPQAAWLHALRTIECLRV